MMHGTIASAHAKIKESLANGGVAIDATCGNGKDTVFLATHATRVIAFDVQKKAIENTERILMDVGLSDKVRCIHASHDTISDAVQESVRVVVFNLGYLPGGDASLTTRKDTTIAAIRQALNVLEPGGLLSVTVYPGHKHGAEEAEALEVYAARLPAKQFTAVIERVMNRQDAPHNIFVYKH